MRVVPTPLVLSSFLFLFTSVSGCGASDEPAEQAARTSAKPVPPLDKAAVLEAADAHDGEKDQVVRECTGCGLMMDGDPAHAHTVEGYELHFCSESCASRFAEDPDKGLSVLSKSLEH